MKKFFNYAGMAVVALAFVACSDDLADSSPNNGAFDAESNGYVKIAINLPTTTASTRGIGDAGDEYGNFNDGDKNEYTVENAILAIFDDKGSTSELEYVMIGAYDLSLGEWTKEDNNAQISTHREIVRKISGAGATGNLHGLVILNKHNFFSLDGNILTFNPNCTDPVVHPAVVCNGKKLSEFAALTLRESGRRYDANSFMMTNMPFTNVPGGATNPAMQGKDVTIKNLYPLEGAIFPTEEAAINGTAAEINVERVLAKVETTLGEGVSTTEHKGYKFKFLGWFVDNTNPNAYIVRHTQAPNLGLEYFSYNNATANTYRMVSAAPISAAQADRYRTFWAIDPNYDVRADVESHDQLITQGGEAVDTRLMKFDAEGNNIGGRLRASGSHYYCTENTFDVQHQSVSNTTRIIVAAQFVDTDGTTPKEFYTLDREPDVMYTKENIIDYTKARIADRASFMMWAHDYLKSTADATKYVKVSISAPTKGYCKATLTHITAEELDDADLSDTSAAAKSAAVAAMNKLIDATDDKDGETGHNEYLEGYKIGFFENGISYYQALIKHFGDVETPWSSSAHAGNPNDVFHIYDDNDGASYLGRYGVVRNNWYKIVVDGIRQIGSPVVPPVPGKDPLDPHDPDTPDDTVDNYLKVKVNIMPWAIRKQAVTL